MFKCTSNAKGVNKLIPTNNDYESFIVKDLKGTAGYSFYGKKRMISIIRRKFAKIWEEALIEHLLQGNEYKFGRGAVRMRIVNRDNASSKFNYNIKTKGIDPVLFVKLSTRTHLLAGNFYLGRMTDEMIDMVNTVIKKGLEFIPLKKSGYVDIKR
jgi:hypothetical protein